MHVTFIIFDLCHLGTNLLSDSLLISSQHSLQMQLSNWTFMDGSLSICFSMILGENSIVESARNTWSTLMYT